MSVCQHVSVPEPVVQPYHKTQIPVTEMNSGKLKHFEWGLYNVIRQKAGSPPEQPHKHAQFIPVQLHIILQYYHEQCTYVLCTYNEC